MLPLMAACAPREVVIGPTPPPPVPPAPAPAPPPPAPPPEAAPATPVSVGLIVDTAALEVGGDAPFEVATEDGRTVARLTAGGTARFTAAGAGAVDVEVRGGAPGTQAVQRGLPAPLVVRPAGEGLLTVGENRYRGDLRVQRAPSGRLTLVNRLDMESYLLGVVPREIGRVGDDLFQAAAAQAVAARTYAVSYLGRRAAHGFDVYATVEDQVYGGVAAEHEPVSRAVRATHGEILTYRGQPITAYYHSTCAGQTAAIEEVWNSAPIPYLVSVTDVNPETGVAYDHFSSRFTWTERWTHAQLVGILNRTLADSLRGATIREIRGMQVRQRTPSGRVASMTLETDVRTFTLGRDRVRWILAPTRGGILNSSKFDVRLVRQGGRVTEIVAEGGGWGHGIGMCQVGAMGRARHGQDYRTILSVYYPGTQLVRAY